MQKMAIFGAGGHGVVVADVLEALKIPYLVIDDAPIPKQLNGISAITKSDFLALRDAKEHGVVLAIGNNAVRKNLYEFFMQNDFCLPSIIHPSAIISKTAKIANAVVVMSNAVVNARTQVSAGAILNTASVVEHDCHVGAFAHIAPNATLCGGVSIGALTHIGAGSVVIEGKSVGEHCVIGAGSVVINPIPSFKRVVGNPAKREV
ncbi:acetyltransferase [Helicobacter turcicus]|uniref:Acetyltransferase n=1 Tax=Helicobacter turcicus TaxID=2867412 RepID=A0ABS7JPZ7_9HELI|nr:acetyltransferase [Helicobacter turcicus]MBX7491467.1 acetyltransferase [Helicobacter turcicus]MBX7545926.1 acetyltransferase [Helicobacter turcicus]